MTITNNQLRASEGQATAASSVVEPPAAPATADYLIPQVSALRYEAGQVHQDVVSLDRAIYDQVLSELTTRHARRSTQSLVSLLADGEGMGWRSMAKMLRVTQPAIRKWRQGQGASPANREAVARLAALMEMLRDQCMIDDAAAWIEIPLAGTRTTLEDVYAAGRIDLLLEYAASRISSPDRLLDQFSPDWRGTEATRPFETFVAEDGQPGIRRVSR